MEVGFRRRPYTYGALSALGSYAVSNPEYSAQVARGFYNGARSAARNFRLPRLVGGRSIPLKSLMSGSGKSVQKGTRSVGQIRSSEVSTVSRKKPMKKKSMKKKFSKKKNRKVNPNKQCIESTQVSTFGHLISDVNKVAWTELFIQTRSDWETGARSIVLNPAISGTTTLSQVESGDVNSSNVYASKTMGLSLINAGNVLFKNNTNATCKLSFYIVRCVDDTDISPTVDLDRSISNSMVRITPGTAIPNAPLTKENNFNQYWNVPRLRQKDRHWKVVSGTTYTITPGSDLSIPFKLKTYGIYPHPFGQIYKVGNMAIVCRLQGTLTHDSTTTSLIGISNTQLDYHISQKYIRYQYDNQLTATVYRTSNPFGLGLIANAVNVSDENVVPYEDK